VKRSFKKDKKDYLSRLAAEAEQAAYANMKEMYDICSLILQSCSPYTYVLILVINNWVIDLDLETIVNEL